MRLALLFLSAAFIGSAQEDPVFRENVQLVRILATVKDQSGALVGSLEKNDFEVRDNGVVQQVSVFERQTDQPLSVAVLIDNSGSTAKDLKYETDSVIRFVHVLLKESNPADAVALYSFNWAIVKQRGFTRNVPSIEHALRSLRGDAGTSLYDAILLASRDIEDRQGRKVLVIVTDGGDTTSHSDFQRATEAAQLADAVIYPVLVVPITNEVGRNVGGENALTTLAERTGGRVFAPSLGAALDQAFDQIIHDLRTQYLLAFYPKNVPLTKDRFHTLEISLRNPQWQVKARNGYYGEALPGASGARIGSEPDGNSVRKPGGAATAQAACKEELSKLTWQKQKPKLRGPPEQTFEEIRYLKHLIEQKIPVVVKLSDDEEVRGVVEYYDQRFIRLTRTDAPNLFIFKHDIKYLYEVS